MTTRDRLILVFSLVCCLALASFVFWKMTRHAHDTRTSCGATIKGLGSDLEMYAADHQGSYPKNLKLLEEKYVRKLPVCGSGGDQTDTYSPGYQVDNAAKRFTLCCKGKHHPTYAIPPDFPRYSSLSGYESGGDD